MGFGTIYKHFSGFGFTLLSSLVHVLPHAADANSYFFNSLLHCANDILIGGPELAAHALRAGLIDECHLFLTPIIVGGAKQRSLTTFDWSLSFWRNAALAVAWFSSVIEQGKEEPPNTARTGRLVSPAKKANLGERFSPFHQLALPAAGNARRYTPRATSTDITRQE